MILQDEEYFPRGGEGGEIKKKRNFVFEKKNLFDAKGKKPGRRERKKKAKQNDTHYEPESDLSFERFEPLVYKGLSEGTLALCCVRDVYEKYADISMPGRLSARLYIENVSQPYYDMLYKQSSELNDEGEKPSPMSSMFRTGQHIHCSVLSVKNDSHFIVRVTSDPKHVNNRLTFDMVKTGTVLQMAVESVEDHGYKMYSGISGLVSFLPETNASAYVNDVCNYKRLAVGQIVWCLVTKSTLCGTSNTVQVTLDFDSIIKSKLDGDINIAMLNPGVRVNVKIVKVVSQNLLVTINDTEIHGYIEESQLSSMWSKPEDYKIGSLHTATVLYKFPYARIVALTLKSNPTTISKNEIKHGTIFENAEIKSIMKRGVCLKLEENGNIYKGVISVRRLGDSVDYVTLSDKFPLGNHIKCRVIGYDALEEVYSCSTDDKLLNEKFLSRSDFKVGQVVDVTVESMKKSGLEVSVGAVQGYVPLHQICDVVIQNPLEKVTMKSKHKAKVLKLENNNIIFTLRPTLVRTPSLASFQHVEVGDSYYGWVNKILPSAIVVSFFGGLYAHIKEENLLENAHKYTVGELVKCYIVELPRHGKIPVFSLLKSVQNMALTVGNTYSLIVKQITKKGLTCFFMAKGQHFNGFIPLAHMCDYAEFCAEEMKKYPHGSVINNVLLLSVNEKIPLFTLKKSFFDFFQKHPEMSEGFKSLKKKMLIPCTVSEIFLDRVLVCAPIPGFNGKIPISAEHLAKKVASYTPYEGLLTCVTDVSISSVEVSLSCHLEENQRQEWAIDNLERFLAYVQPMQTCPIGSQVDCKVIKITEKSLDVVVISKNLKGVIKTNSSHNFKRGQILKAVVLYHAVKENLVYLHIDNDLSMSKSLKASLKNTAVSGTVLHVNPHFIIASITGPEGNLVFLPTLDDPNNPTMAISVKDVPIFSTCTITLRSVKELSGENTIYFWIGSTDSFVKIMNSKKRKSEQNPSENNSFSDNMESLVDVSEIPKKKNKREKENNFDIENVAINVIDKNSTDDFVLESKGDKKKKKKQNLEDSTRIVNALSKECDVQMEVDSKAEKKRKKNKADQFTDTLAEESISHVHLEVSSEEGNKKRRNQKTKDSSDMDISFRDKQPNDCKVVNSKNNSFIVSDLSMNEDCDENVNNSSMEMHKNVTVNSPNSPSFETVGGKKQKKKKRKGSDDKNLSKSSIEIEGNVINAESNLDLDDENEGNNAKLSSPMNKKKDKNKKTKVSTDVAQVESVQTSTNENKNKKKRSIENQNQNLVPDNKKMKTVGKGDSKISEAKMTLLEDIGGFKWDATLSDISKVTSGTVEEDDLSQDSDEETKPAKKLTPAEKRVAAYEAERLIREKEEELLVAENNPQSAEHFDRILTANPNSSKLWIMYMAHHMQATEIEKARSVAKRALKHINVRLEDERLNVWIASLNLENMYGTPDSFKEVLNEALKYNDDYKVYKRVLDIYAESNKTVELEKLVHQLVKKYKNKMDCWVECQTSLMKAGLHDKARNYLQRSLEALPTKDYCTLVSRFALVENKCGFADQAHSLFENLLTSYPQRVDLWFVYIDMLTKSGATELARNVLERATAHKLPIRKMKALYQKWMKFEETYGTPEKVQEVKDAATNYVKNITSPGAFN